MNKSDIVFSDNIDEQDSLYRYISLSQFMAFVENKELFLRKVTLWDDPWEGLDRQIPRMRDNGDLEYPNCSLAESVVGQCWTYEKDSDAMWRIYSSDKLGIMIESKASNFRTIENLKRAILVKVKYFNNENFLSKWHEINNDRSYRFAGTMALKREAFKHENEVRLLVCMQGYYDEDINPWDLKSYGFKVSPFEFVESITVDPRAEEWYVNTIKKYCDSKGFNCSVSKSNLYQNQTRFSEEIKLVQTYAPVKKD